MKYKFLIITIFFVMLFSVGCSTKKGVPFTNLVQDEVVKIDMRHPGSGVLYSTTDSKLINQFVLEMKQGGADYYETNPMSSVGNGVYVLYNADNTAIAKIVFLEKGVVKINGTYYGVKADIDGILKPFHEEFLKDKNIVKES